MSNTLVNNFGIPLIWLFSTTGDMLRDFYGNPISAFITGMEYTYDEEDDDECEITFQLEDINNFDLPYFQQDVVIVVQWGYLTKGGEYIKSPRRKVAIRDIENKYNTKGLKTKILCTDLVAYIKGFKTQTIRKYQNPNAKNALQAIGSSEDNFIDWLKEVSEGVFKPTITLEDKAVRWDLVGQQRNADYDPKSGSYTVARDNARISRQFFTTFHSAQVIKGKSKALNQAILDKLKYLNAQKGLGGHFLANSTDDTLHIHQRNFKQKPYKSYIFKKGNGELLDFKSSTNTRKTKEDTSTSSGINPYSKKIEKTEINTADLGILERDKKTSSDTYVTDKERSFQQYYKQAREIFKNNIENPDNQKELPDLTYNKVNIRPKYVGPNNAYTHIEKVTVPSNEILNIPEFRKLVEDGKNTSKAQFKREQVLLGHVIEKIQRKYEARAEVLGDPSLIKSKIYGFINLSRLDNGYWYATKVTHKLKMGSAYTCDIELIKKPSTIGINKQSHKAIANTTEDVIEWENEIENEDLSVYEEEVDNRTLLNNIDISTKKPFEQIDVIQIQERLNYINAEEDFVLGSSDFKEDSVFKEDEHNEINKPNSDKN